jgi:hypothetical protein
MAGRVYGLLLVLLVGSATAAGAQRPPLERVKLRQPTVIDGVPCAGRSGAFAPSASLYPSGRLAACRLAEPAVLFGQPLPEGAWLHLNEDGTPRYVFLGRTTELQGHRCRGSGATGWQTVLYPSGRLRVCWLAEDAVIDGVPCRRASFFGELSGNTSVVLREDGRLASCRVSSPVSVGDRVIAKGERL